jgi:hypothetical protein
MHGVESKSKEGVESAWSIHLDIDRRIGCSRALELFLRTDGQISEFPLRNLRHWTWQIVSVGKLVLDTKGAKRLEQLNEESEAIGKDEV